MEDLQQQVLGVLNDPEKLSQVLDMAKGLGFPPPESEAPQEGNSRSALLKALTPYLKPDRRKRLERAIELSQLSDLARFALQNQLKSETEDASDV